MKLLLVNSWGYMRGGDARCTFEQEAAFVAAGHEVERFHMIHPENRPATYARAFARRVDWQRSLPEGVVGRGAALAAAIWSRDSARRFDRVLRHFQPDVVHIHHLHRHLTPSILPTAARREIPVFWTLHDYELLCPNGLLFTHDGPCERCRGGRWENAVRHRCKRGARQASVAAALEQAAHQRIGILRWVDGLICPSRFLLEKARSWGLGSRADRGANLHLVPHAAPLEWLHAPPAGRPSEAAPFVFGGRLAREKGVDTLVRAVAREPRARLRVFGSGPMEAELKALAESEAPGRVTFEGHASSAVLMQAVDDGLAVILPSIWYENQPYTLLEAAARGRPVIASDIGGIPETIARNGGLLFPPGDHEALASRLGELLDFPTRAAELGTAARQDAEERRRPHDWVERQIQVYRSCGAGP